MLTVQTLMSSWLAIRKTLKSSGDTNRRQMVPPRLLKVTETRALQIPERLPTPLSSPTETKMDTLSGAHSVESSGKSKSYLRRRRTQNVIQQQINLEILLKRNEVRLIDHELTNCRTALEHLRRCTEIPYPATKLRLRQLSRPLARRLTGVSWLPF